MRCPPKTIDTTGMDDAVKTRDDQKRVAKEVYRIFTQYGCSDASAKGILANIMAESSFVPNVLVGDSGSISGGLFQFHWNGELNYLCQKYGRCETVRQLNSKYHNIPTGQKINENFPFTFEEQMRYIVEDVFKRSVIRNILPINDPSDAAWRWVNDFEKPKIRDDRWKKYGNTILGMLT